MELKIGDIVEFKKYGDLDFDEKSLISKNELPESGKVKKVIMIGRNHIDFYIEGNLCCFSNKYVERVISDVDDFKNGEQIWVKAIVNVCYNDTVFINPIERFFNKDDVLKIVKRKEPEYFIVKEDYYGMCIGTELELVSDKSKAKVYTSRDTAVKDAAEMFPYDKWEVIPYDD